MAAETISCTYCPASKVVKHDEAMINFHDLGWRDIGYGDHEHLYIGQCPKCAKDWPDAPDTTDSKGNP